MIDCHRYLLLLSFVTATMCYACPITVPCYCIGENIMTCASKRIPKVPYFLSFHRTLDELDLSDNLLTAIMPNSLSGVQVHRISLNNNLISELTGDSFAGIQHVSSMDLCHNQLHMINADVFVPLATQLTELKLCYNRLSALSSRVFATLTQVSILDLSGNELKTVPTSALQHLTSLSEINLRNNRLKKIAEYSFADIPLQKIDLGNNASPMHINEKAFCGLEPSSSNQDQRMHASELDIPGLRELVLDHNGLGSFEPCLARILWTLESIDLTGNPIRCDCRLFLYKDWGAPTQFPGAQCAVPWKYEGEMLDDIMSVNYSCSDDKIDRLYRRCNDLCPKIVKEWREFDFSSAISVYYSGYIVFTIICISFYINCYSVIR